MKKKIAIAVFVLGAFWVTRFYWILIFILFTESFAAKRLNEAFKETELYGKKYILAEACRVTGYDWALIKNENGRKEYEFIRIVGSNPDELILDYDFILENNKYIFYVEERRNIYFEDIEEEGIEYVVTGWNILYPVKHAFYPIDVFFHTRKYITEMDTHIGIEKFRQKTKNALRILGCGEENCPAMPAFKLTPS